uniref:Uncharacterized protein n=1 Tax=Cannabis sativa TaxID=3483 RepID=A0A803QD18_CANSA
MQLMERGRDGIGVSKYGVWLKEDDPTPTCFEAYAVFLVRSRTKARRVEFMTGCGERSEVEVEGDSSPQLGNTNSTIGSSLSYKDGFLITDNKKESRGIGEGRELTKQVVEDDLSGGHLKKGKIMIIGGVKEMRGGANVAKSPGELAKQKQRKKISIKNKVRNVAKNEFLGSHVASGQRDEGRKIIMGGRWNFKATRRR